MTPKMTSRRFHSLCQIDHFQLTTEQPTVRPLTHMKTSASFLATSNALSNQGEKKNLIQVQYLLLFALLKQ